MTSQWLALQGAQRLMKAVQVKADGYSDRREAAATGGALIVENSAKDKARYRTGTLKRSIDHETIEKGPTSCTVSVGTNLISAKIHEFGGTIYGRPFLVFKIEGQVIFARSVTIPAQPYLRPAIIETRKEVVGVVRQILKGS